MHKGSSNALALFFNRIFPEPNTGCWLFSGAITKDGYGRVEPQYHNNFSKAHRFSYFIHKGEFNRELCVLHFCDTPCCVNPDHLWLGTNDENMADMVRKKRSPRGIRNCKAKLNDQLVSEIRSITNLSRKEIAKKYNISKTNLCSILNKQIWI